MGIDWKWFQNLVNGSYDQSALWGPQVSSADALPGQVSGVGQQWPGANGGSDLLYGVGTPDSSGQSIGELAATQQMDDGLFKNGKGGFRYRFNLGSLMSGK